VGKASMQVHSERKCTWQRYSEKEQKHQLRRLDWHGHVTRHARCFNMMTSSHVIGRCRLMLHVLLSVLGDISSIAERPVNVCWQRRTPW